MRQREKKRRKEKMLESIKDRRKLLCGKDYGSKTFFRRVGENTLRMLMSKSGLSHYVSNLIFSSDACGNFKVCF